MIMWNIQEFLNLQFRVSDWEIFISTKLTEAFIVEFAAKHLD